MGPRRGGRLPATRARRPSSTCALTCSRATSRRCSRCACSADHVRGPAARRIDRIGRGVTRHRSASRHAESADSPLFVIHTMIRITSDYEKLPVRHNIMRLSNIMSSSTEASCRSTGQKTLHGFPNTLRRRFRSRGPPGERGRDSGRLRPRHARTSGHHPNGDGGDCVSVPGAPRRRPRTGERRDAHTGAYAHSHAPIRYQPWLAPRHACRSHGHTHPHASRAYRDGGSRDLEAAGQSRADLAIRALGRLHQGARVDQQRHPTRREAHAHP